MTLIATPSKSVEHLYYDVLVDAILDQCGCENERGSSLSTAEAVATTGVVCGVCSFTAGLLLGVLLTQCHGHCHRNGKRGQTEIPPVYEDIPLENTPPIELNTNEAYFTLNDP